MDWQTFGHEQVKRILGQQLLSGRLPHAYLFLGPDGIGKKILALEFAKKLLETGQLTNHPDFQMLGSEDLTMERVVEFIGQLSFKPFAARRKVAIIDAAESLNPSSGNALLKTLEEPPKNTVLILVAGRQTLLPTIVSRCCVLRFNAFSRQQLMTFAAQQGLPAPEAVLTLSFGKISRLRQLLADADYLGQQQNLAAQWEDIKSQRRGQRLLSVTRLSGEETENLPELLTTWLFCQAARLGHEPKSYQTAQCLLDGLVACRTNQNKKLILQNLFLKV